MRYNKTLRVDDHPLLKTPIKCIKGITTKERGLLTSMTDCDGLLIYLIYFLWSEAGGQKEKRAGYK